MWTRDLIFPIALLVIQVTYPSEGELLEKTLGESKNLNEAFEACVKVGKDSDIMNGILKILRDYYEQDFFPKFDGIIIHKVWLRVLESDPEEEARFLSTYGVQEDLSMHLDTVFSHLYEFCTSHSGDSNGEEIAWKDPMSFGKDMVYRFFHVLGRK